MHSDKEVRSCSQVGQVLILYGTWYYLIHGTFESLLHRYSEVMYSIGVDTR